jgi:hypothetical protein
VQLRARVVRAGEAAAAQAHRAHPEVAPVLLHQHVGCDLGGAEDRVRRLVDPHLFGDAAVPGVRGVDLEARLALDQR